ncbi:MAG: response regulator [Usitatibacteraceae bacterium]|jgi:two-component system OmpR family response regulator
MRILIAEDDATISAGLTRALRDAGYVTDHVSTGTAADSAVASQSFDLVILDIGLPSMDGLHVLRRMRERKDATPVLILTALDGIDDRVQGLNCGADDYLVKPFSLRELEARIRALLRRTTGQSQLIVTHGRLHFDANARTAYAGDQVIELSVREFGLLEIFLTRKGRVISKSVIIDLLFEWGEEVSANAVEVYIHRLRKKVEVAGVHIRTIRGVGYCLDPAIE